MNSTLYFAAFLFIFGSAIIAIFNIHKKWIEKQIKNKKFLKIVKISANILSVIVIGLSALIGISELNNRKEDAKYDGIFVTPTVISVPVKSGREVPITVTNNFPHPIYMVGLEFTLTEGDIALDFGTNFMIQPFLGGAFMGNKHISGHVPAILGKSSATYIFTINTKDFEKATRIEVEVSYYTKQPVPNWFKDNQKDLPKTMQLPEGFIPEIIYINKKKK